jgi:hypothetical protein
MPEWLNKNLTIFVLLFLALVMVGMTLHIAHSQGVDQGMENWSREETGTVIGALLLALTGKGRADPPHADDPVTTIKHVQTEQTTVQRAVPDVIPPPPPTPPAEN